MEKVKEEKCKGYECCKKVYQAFDGKTFDTKEECKDYNQRPRIFKVTLFVPHVYGRCCELEEYYLDYQTAKLREEVLEEACNGSTSYPSFRVIEFSDNEKAINKNNERISELKEKQLKAFKEKQQKIKDERKSRLDLAWENIKSFFKSPGR